MSRGAAALKPDGSQIWGQVLFQMRLKQKFDLGAELNVAS